MTETAHKDPSKGWLVLFFVAFIITVFGIGVWQLVTHYNPDAGRCPCRSWAPLRFNRLSVFLNCHLSHHQGIEALLLVKILLVGGLCRAPK